MDDYGVELRTRLAKILGDGRWLCFGLMASGARQMSVDVAEIAGLDPSLVCGLAVFGDDPEPESPYQVVTLNETGSGDFVADLLRAPDLVATPSPKCQALVEAWDPSGQAKALVVPFMTDTPLAHRATFGARPLRWTTLEDKLTIGSLWDRVGVARAPSDNIDLLDSDRLLQAHRALASPAGTVWAVDNSKGLHGGANGTRWVHTEPDTTRIGDEFRRLGYQQVRIMPFLIGVPCSIHGVVFDDRTVALRPNEMLVYVDPESGRFRYSRAANYWDPERQQRSEMVEAVVAIGDEMRNEVDFRGVFTLDGVMTDEGFRPTEVNPRYGVALRSSVPTGDGGTLNLFMLNMALVERAIDIDPDRFEQWLVPTLEANRAGGGMVSTSRSPDGARAGSVRFGVRSDSPELLLVPADEDDGGEGDSGEGDSGEGDGGRGDGERANDDVVAEIRWQPHLAGGLLRVTFGSGCPIGPATAPLLSQILNLVDSEWDCGLGPLVPALEVR